MKRLAVLAMLPFAAIVASTFVGSLVALAAGGWWGALVAAFILSFVAFMWGLSYWCEHEDEDDDQPTGNQEGTR